MTDQPTQEPTPDSQATVLDRRRKTISVNGRTLELVEPPGRVFREILKAQSSYAQSVSTHSTTLASIQAEMLKLSADDPDFAKKSEDLTKRGSEAMVRAMEATMLSDNRALMVALNWQKKQVDNEFLDDLAVSQKLGLTRAMNEVLGINPEEGAQGNGLMPGIPMAN